MIYVIADLNDNSITINDVPYTKVYDFKIGTDAKKVTLKNVFDSHDVVFRNVDVSNIQIEGVEYETALEVMEAFEPLKKKVAEGDGGDLTLQQVTTAGNTTNTNIGVISNEFRSIVATNTEEDTTATLVNDGRLLLGKYSGLASIRAQLLDDAQNFQLPNESGILVVDAPTDSQNYTRKDNTWVVAPVGGTPTLDAVLGVGNTSTNKVINMNLGSSAIAINVLGNTTNTFRTQIYPGGIMLKNSSNKNVISMVVSGSGTTGVFQLVNTSGTGSVQLRGDNLSVEVSNGGFGGTLVQSALLKDRLTFKQVGGLDCYIKPETVPYDATPEWTLPGAFGKLAVIKTTAPASATDAGVVGEIRVTSTFVYYCIAPNTWVRSAVATW